MQTTIELPCECEYPFQDKQYGKGIRLHNISQEKGKLGKKAYCTVCSGGAKYAKRHSTSSPRTANRDYKLI